MQRISILFICLMLVMPGVARADSPAPKIDQTITVDEAYKAIPHDKTRFDPALAYMNAGEKQFLDTFFGLSDLAVAERVEVQQAISSGAAADDNYSAILARLKSLDIPPKLATAHKLVTEAVDEQRQYLQILKKGGSFDANAPLVESSHEKLVAAYGELMRLYPSEEAHNKQAFYDHLCALDFK